MASIADVFVTVLPETGKIASGIEKALRSVDVRKIAKVWAKEIEAALRDLDAEIEAKVDTKKVKAEIERASKDQKATIKADADTRKAEAELDHAARDRTSTIRAKVDMDRGGAMGMQAAQSGMAAASMGAQGASSGFSALSSSMSSVGGSGATMGIALAAAVPALTALAGVAAAAAGALALLPAAFAGVALGAGVLTVGLSGITDAYEAVSGAAKDASKDQADHARTVQSAHRSVESASRSLNSAIKSEEQAQKDVARARRDALHELEDINDELRNGAIDETQAQLDLAKARDELATGTFESSLDYQQAQLNVIKAEQRLKDAHEDNVDLETEVADKRAKGVDQADQVVAAEDRLATAQQNTADAQARLADAQTRLAEANSEVSTSAQKAADAMGLLSPAGQDFVNTLMGLTPVWDKFKQDLQQPLLAGLGETLTNTVNALLPAVTPGLQRIAAAFNQAFQQVGEWLQKPENLAMLENIVNNIATAFEKLGPAVQPFLTAMGTLLSSGSDFLPDLATGLADAAIAFGNFMTEAAESGALEEFIQIGLDTLKQLGPLLPKIVDLFEKLVPLGITFAPILFDLTGKFLDLMGSLSELWTILTKISPVLNVTLPLAFNIIKGAIDGVVTALRFLGNMFKWVWDLGNNLGNLFKNVLTPTLDSVRTKIHHVKDAIRIMGETIIAQVPILQKLQDKFTRVFDRIKGIFTDAKTWMKVFFDFVKFELENLIPDWIKRLIPDWGGGSTPPPSGPSPTAPPGDTGSKSHNVGGGVPGLHEKSPGKWTSTDKRWADLIDAESGGVPDVTQKIKDVNSGGNEAEGLFQITPQTWKANGGEEFAPSPKLATPAEQGIVAMRILQKNPSGSDWGPVGRGEIAAPSLSTSAPTPSAPSGPSPTTPSGPSPSPETTQRIPYGLPAGTDIRQGAAGFPQWVYDLGAQFNVTPSTYAGHQEKSGQNQGIDWWGTTEDLQRFAEYLEANPDLAEQVIFSNPETGEKTGMAMGQKVGPGTSQPNYYDANWAGHTEHVHTRFSMSAGAGGAPGTPSSPTSPGTPSDSHVIPLDPNVPPGQQKVANDYGKNLGQDIMSGIMEIFGLGDIFPDPTQFGLFKIFKSLTSLKPAAGGPNGGPTNADAGSGGGPGGGGLLDFFTGLIPNINGSGGLTPVTAPQPGGVGGSVDNSFNLTVNPGNQNDGKFIMNTVNTEHLNNQRSNLGNMAGK